MTRCNYCVMDDTDPDIFFDKFGNCNHCITWSLTSPETIGEISDIVNRIKTRATGDYDGILGISGGADSSYVAFLSRGIGLNPLLVHLNDGWNSKEAEQNVQIIVNKTGFDFVEVKLDETEFRDIIISYLHAGVVGLEAPTDNCIMTALHDVLDEYGLNNIISGSNWATEGIAPRSWEYTLSDATNIKAIHKRLGTMPLKKIKLMGLLRKRWRMTFGGVREFRLLNHIDYNRRYAIAAMVNKWGFQDTGRKHHENRYTRFVEDYIYPTRFGFDKRLAHYSALICSIQISREKALQDLESPPYTEEDLLSDKEFFLEKLGIDEFKFNHFMNLPIRSHYDFPTHKWTLRLLGLLRPIKRIFR